MKRIKKEMQVCRGLGFIVDGKQYSRQKILAKQELNKSWGAVLKFTLTEEKKAVDPVL